MLGLGRKTRKNEEKFARDATYAWVEWIPEKGKRPRICFLIPLETFWKNSVQISN